MPEDVQALPSPSPMKSGRWIWVALLLVICFVGLIRFRLRDLPLERDEGEYAYMGQLMLEGVPPFKLAYSMKLPGTSVMYAGMMAVFGQTAAGIHLGLLVVNAATIVLVFLLGRKLMAAFSGLVAAACYAILSLQPSVMGIAAHATHFVVLFAVAGILLLLTASEKKRAALHFFCGLSFGLAFVMKQPGLFFGLFGGLFLLRIEWNGESCGKGMAMLRVALYALGALLPFAVVCVWLRGAGTFQRFWFWTFTYAFNYGARQSLEQGLTMLKFHFTKEMGWDILFWALTAAGIFFLWRDKSKRALAVFLTALLLTSAIAVGQGLFFRSHYFVLLLPALCLAIAAGVDSSRKWISRRYPAGPLHSAPTGVLAAAGLIVIFSQGSLFFDATPAQASQQLYSLYGTNPFPDSAAIAGYIRDHSKKDDTIAVIGSEPQIYFHADRRSATGYIYTFSLVEPGPMALPMQKEMIAEIEAARPEFVVMVQVTFSWAFPPQFDHTILAWTQKYCTENYDMVGVVNYPAGSAGGIFHWQEDAPRHIGDSSEKIFIFQRKHPVPAAP